MTEADSVRTATVMLAPNGARRMKADHPALPLGAAEIARCAAESRAAGADAIHVHIRDRDGRHLLDVDGYCDVTRAIRREAGSDFFVQITTEAVGRFSPAEQMAVVRGARPKGASCALKELVPNAAAEGEAAAFYADCATMGIAVQHIVYAPGEIATLADLMARDVVPDNGTTSVLCVLGRNDAGEAGQVHAFHAFCMMMDAAGIDPRATMFCAFGQPETRMLAAALGAGRNVRVGFENNVLNGNGTVAADNVERVAAIHDLRTRLGLDRPDEGGVASTLGTPPSP